MHRLTTCVLGSLVPVLSVVGACGGGSDGPVLDPPVTCRTGNCGNETFRRAVPSKTSVEIDSPRKAAKRAGRPLDAISEEFTLVSDYVDATDDQIAGVFADLEYMVGGTPTEETAESVTWEFVLEDNQTTGILEVALTSEDTFHLTYTEDDLDSNILDGEVSTDGDGLASFTLDFDLAADAEQTGEVKSGVITLAGHPFAGGAREIFYDEAAVSFGGSAPRNTRSTYWRFDDDSDGLEFLQESEAQDIEVYARWDDEGDGRYDSHASADEGPGGIGLVETIQTACWTDFGAEEFDAFAFYNDTDFYGEIEGNEDDCFYGPVDDHPDPGSDFDDLPQDGEWDLIELLAVPAGRPSVPTTTERVRPYRTPISHI